MPRLPKSDSRISRRTVLRGTGVTMALPWLESMSAFAETATPNFPKRFAVLFMGNGVNEDHWGSEGSGAAMTLRKSLSPLEPLKHKINVIHGLFNKMSTGQGIHPAQTGSLLSGATIQRGAIIKAGITVDQLLANRIGQDNPQASIVLACEQPMTGYHETNFSMAYSSHISWQTPDSPVPNEVYPSLAWDNLFENRGSLRNMSILDRVMDDAASLTREISVTDKAKLDEYFTSVRDLEKRLASAEEWSKKRKPKVDAKQPQDPRDVDIVARTRTWFDLIHLALQTDSTRLITMVVTSGGGPPPVAGVSHDHHDLTHHGQDPTKIKELQLIEFELMKAMRDLLAKLKQTKEEGVSLLDRTTVFFGSNLGNASYHSTTNLPVLLAGGGFRHGQHLAFDPKNHPPLCNLYVSMLQRLGIEVDRFGSSTGTLTGLETAG